MGSEKANKNAIQLTTGAKIGLFTVAAGAIAAALYYGKQTFSEWGQKLKVKIASVGRPALSPTGKLSIPLVLRITNVAPVGVTLDNATVKLLLPRDGSYTLVGQTDPTGPITINASGDTNVNVFPHIDLDKLKPVIVGSISNTLTNLLTNTSALLDLKVESKITIQGYDIAQSTFTKIYLSDLLNMLKSKGLGLVPTGKRSVTPVPANLKSLVPNATGNNEVIKPYGADPLKDTVPLIQRLVKRQLWQGKKLAAALKGNSIEQTVKNNWDFFNRHIQFKTDADGKEQVRSLRRLVHEGKGDCDCYVNGLSNLLTNQGIAHKLRVTSYNGSNSPSHIYIQVPANGKTITLDPVVHKFNYEVPFTTKKDFANAA